MFAGFSVLNGASLRPISSKRFTQEDPIGFGGGINLYGFAEGDPVNFSDPFGLCPRVMRLSRRKCDRWDKLRPVEREALRRIGWVKTYRIYPIEAESEDEADRRYPREPDEKDGLNDAFKHIYGAAHNRSI